MSKGQNWSECHGIKCHLLWLKKKMLYSAPWKSFLHGEVATLANCKQNPADSLMLWCIVCVDCEDSFTVAERVFLLAEA